MTTARPAKPLDRAVIGRAADGRYFARDCATGDVALVEGVGRPLTPLERHVCGDEEK